MRHARFVMQGFAIQALALLALSACGADDDETLDDTGDGGDAAGHGSGGASAGSGGRASAGSGGSIAGTGGKGSAAGNSGNSGNGGTSGAGGKGGTAGSGGTGVLVDAGVDSGTPELDHFSFFVTSFEGLQRLADSQDGFGGDLSYGQADGLSGADKICEELAESSMPGSAVKQWRAFLSAKQGPNGQQVNAIERIGEGPWYDRRKRLLAWSKDDLLHDRPLGADSVIVDDLPNESGTPNMQPDPTQDPEDNHHVLTGSNEQGELYGDDATCDDWTSTASTSGRPRIGFSWPEGGRVNWISGQDEGGCGAGAVLHGMGGSDPGNPIVGSGGGYGAIYCFALAP